MPNSRNGQISSSYDGSRSRANGGDANGSHAQDHDSEGASDHIYPNSSQRRLQDLITQHEQNVALARDVAMALGLVLLVFLAAYVYTGNWPPVVVIESGSMEHPDDESTMRLGTIDTGDLVLAKAVNEREDIVTYLEGEQNDYKTYGDYGDVIIYDKNGQGGTPVIHRVMAWVEVTATPDGLLYRIPEANLTYTDIEGIVLPRIGVDWKGDTHGGLGKNSSYGGFGVLKWSGFLTKGDSLSNPNVDQHQVLTDAEGEVVQPVQVGFILGKARGELPWMGLLKLRLTQKDNYDLAQEGPKLMLKVVLGTLFGILGLLMVLPYLMPPPKELEQAEARTQVTTPANDQASQANESRPNSMADDKGPPQPPPGSPMENQDQNDL